MKKLLTLLFAVFCYVQTSAYTLYYYHEGDYKYAVWYWGCDDEVSKWSDWMSPVSGHDNWYSVNIPSDCENVIFVTFDKSVSAADWSYKKSQTADLVYDGTHAYYVEGKGWQLGFDGGSDDPIEAPADCTASGSCGANLIWCYNSTTHILTITGSGAMNDYSSSTDIPWFSYRSEVTSVSLPDGLTSIGDAAFPVCTNLTSITIPYSVTSIGDRAFINCTGLTSVTIGNSVTSIGYRAFYGCTGLAEINWNAKECADFHASPFESAQNTITSFVFGSEVMHIPAYLCNGMSSLTSISIPNSVTSIGDWAFSGCVGLTNIDIPYSVTSIGDRAFSGCVGLTNIDIPNSVTSIGNWAFEGCTGLTSVTIPNSVTSIGDYAFARCTGLTSVTIPNSVTSIGDWAFSGCSSLTSIEIPNSVTSIGDYAFSLVPNIVYNGSASGSPWGARSVNGYVDGYFVYKDSSKTELLACSPAATGSITIPNSVTSIGNLAFSGCTGLTSVTIPNSVISIGVFAFSGCTGLTSVTIPNSVTSIGDDAFSGCTGLTAPVYNAHVFAYMPTSYSGSYTIPDGIESIAGSAFYGCTGLTSVTIPNSMTSIGEGAFAGCTGLTSVTIPNSVTSIGFAAFEGCTGLTSVTNCCIKPQNINTNVFYQCGDLSNIVLYVPSESVEIYKNKDVWRDFYVQPMQITAIESVDADGASLKPRKVIENGRLVIIMPDGRKFDASGRRLER